MRKYIRKIDTYLFNRVLTSPINSHRISGQGFISFTFDDFPLSATTRGIEILNQYEIKGTFYLSASYLNKTIAGIPMVRSNDLMRLVKYNHEIGCHTYDHADSRKVSAGVFKMSLLENVNYLKKLIPDYEMVSFSFPKGGVSTIKKFLVKGRYSSARTIKPGINKDGMDTHLLKANPLYSESSTMAIQIKLIDELQQTAGWLIFYTHDIDDNPSQFGCTPKYFKNVVEYAVKSGSEILSVKNVLARLTK